MNSKAIEKIGKLNLLPHPEGGYYRETYRSSELVLEDSLPKRYKGNRNLSTSIYFLLEGEQYSKFHRLKSDEIWHFYSGSSLTIHSIDQNGNYKKVRISSSLEDGDFPQVVIPSGVWFSAELNEKDSFALIGCTVSPGFDFDDFELGRKDDLLIQFPKYKSLIEKLT
ncbi:MAG: cupin domain-containing protein [Ignavibacteriales bacterium]|nr:cupin domain-containing protein [Ignavibacteriales bacterium]